MKKGIYLLSLMLLFASSVSFAQVYNQEEVAALKVFFKEMSANAAVTNGQVLNIENVDDWNPETETAKLEWNDESPKRVKLLLWSGCKLGGTLDLRAFKGLEAIECNENSFSKILFAEDMPKLTKVFVRKCGLKELILPKNAPLMSINCAANAITTLQLPDNPDKIALCWANDNQLRFSTLPYLDMEEGYSYSPQDTIYVSDYTNIVDLSGEYRITVKGLTDQLTTYNWFMINEGGDKVAIAPGNYTMDKGRFVFDSGFAYKHLICEMSNNFFPDLQLTVSVTPKIQQYVTEELEAIKAFLRQPSKLEGKTNAEILRVTDVDNWNPEDEPAELVWSEDTPRRLTLVLWVLKDVAGTLDLSNCSKIQRVETNMTGIKEIILPEEAPELSVVYCPQSDMTKLVLPKNAPSFGVLNCYMNKLEELSLPDVVGDKFEVRAHSNNISSFIVPDGIKEQLYLLWLHENKLTEIQLPDALPELRYLYLRDNKLTACTLPEDISALEYFWIERNNMRFSSLPVAQIPETYTYSPQDTLWMDAKGNSEIDLSGEYSIQRNGVTKITEYQWYEVENGMEKKIAEDKYVNNQGVFSFKETIGNKYLICKMKNENFAELTLVCVINSPLTSIASKKAEAYLNLYPNPADEWVNIDLSNCNDVIRDVIILDISGKAVCRKAVNDKATIISLQGWPAGSYFVKIKGYDKEYMKKLIVK